MGGCAGGYLYQGEIGGVGLMKERLLWLAVSATLFAANGVLAQSDPVSDSEAPTEFDEFQNADVFDVDLFSPTAPALVVLGVSPKNTADPGTFKDFGFDVTNVGDGDKNRIGVAFTTTPYWWGTRALTLEDYRTQNSAAERIWARTQLSLGLARAGGRKTESLSLGFGVQSQLLDAQDHKFDQESFACIQGAWDQLRRPEFEDATKNLAGEIAEALGDVPIGEEPDEIDIDLDDFFEGLQGSASEDQFLGARRSCQDQATARLLAKPSWMAGIGLGARSDDDQLTDFEFDGVSLWTSYRQPLDARGRFAVLGFLRGDLDKTFDLGGDLRKEGDAVLAGLGGAFQIPWLRVDLSASFNHRSFTDSAFENDDFIRYTGLVDVRVREGLWLEVAGGTIASSDFNNGAFGSINVKISWGEYLPFF